MNGTTEIIISVCDMNESPAEVYSSNAKSVLLLGREPSCDVVIAGRGVSRKHCCLSFTGVEWTVQDLGGINGTILQRAATTVELRGNSHPLTNRDILELGEVRLRVEVPSTDFDATQFIPRPAQQNDTDLIERNEVANRTAPIEQTDGSKPDVDNRDLESEVQFEVASNRVAPFDFFNYHVLKKIGDGGMGEVYLAQRKSKDGRNERYAIKFLRTGSGGRPQDRQRFLREMEISTLLRHPTIIECLQSGVVGDELFLVMPFCAGGNLDMYLRRVGRLDVRRGLRLLDRLLDGLEFAHQQGVVHRDLKPSNVLLSRTPEGKFLPKIADFGLAKFYQNAGDSGMTTDGCVGGSWPYMPREQLVNFRYVTPQSDVWSVAAIAYECLTLQHPRSLPNCQDRLRVVLEGTVTPLEHHLPNVSPKLERFLMRALSTNLEERYRDASQMRAALRGVANESGIEL
jgi:pSer/pThr/pTyr-binding forkhead associated (FHA) protein/tRNA A-37 threonylcarbamoyl transferase component Bud32